MNKAIRDFLREKDRQNWEFWKAYYEARKPMEDVIKKWMDAREEMNRPIREYFHKKWIEELNE